MVLISGESGLGKSRVVSEVKKHAERQHMLVLEGNCFELDHTTPYAPVLDHLQAIIRTCGVDQSGNSRNHPNHSTPNGYDWTQTVIELRNSVLEPRQLQNQSDQTRRKYSRELAQFFVRFAATQPILLVVEDLQWIDDSSLEFLHYLARMVETTAIMVLATYRSDEVLPTLRHFLAALDRERLGTEIMMERLTIPQVDRMLRAILGLNRSVRPEFLDAIYTLTGGNPYSIEEILRSLGSMNDLLEIEAACEHTPLLALPVPRSVQDVVQRKLSLVSSEAGDVLSLAAIFGNEFDFELLRTLSGYDEASLLKLMKELVETQLVIEESADRFAFRDTLTRQAIYTRLLARERRGLHKKLAEAIESCYLGTQTDYLPELAYHFFEAGSMERAVVYSERAGQASLEQHRPRAAVEQLSRALEATHQLSAVPSPRLYHLRSKAFATLGWFDRATSDCETALRIAVQMRDREAEWQSLFNLGTVWLGRDYARAGDYLRQARQLAQEIGKPWKLANTLGALGKLHMAVEQPLEALQCLYQGLAICQEHRHLRGEAETLEALGGVSYAMGNLREAAHFYEWALSLAYQQDDKQLVASIMPMLVSLREPSYLHNTAPIAPNGENEAGLDIEQCLKTVQQTQDRVAEIKAYYILSSCAGGRGNYTRAFALAQAAIQSAEEIDHPETLAAANTVLGALYLDILAFTEARRYLERGLTFAQQAGSQRWAHYSAGLLASASISRGDFEYAEAVLDEIPPSHTPDHSLAQRTVSCARADLALTVGAAHEALEMVDRLIEPLTTPLTDLSFPAPRVTRLKAEALTMLNRCDEAEATLHVALQAAELQEAGPAIWRTQVALGKLRDQQGTRSQADDEYRCALGTIGDLGASIPDEQLRSTFVNAASGMVPRVHRTVLRAVSRKEYGGLTARELEVATLVGQAMSTQQIAEALMVGKRTIETHLSSILSKLGYTSRKQIAVWASERDLSGKQAG